MAAECWAWAHGIHPRTTRRVIDEYRDWRVDLAAPVLAIRPDGRLERSTVGAVRARNWDRIVEALAELGVRAGRVFEIGAGDGTNVRALRARAPAITWFGGDLVPRSADVVALDAGRLPLPTGSVDAVVTYNALEQMPREIARQALHEIARVTRRGLVSIEPDYQLASWPQRLAMIRKDYVRDIEGPATAAGLRLVRREWTIGGNPLNRPGIFLFRPARPRA